MNRINNPFIIGILFKADKNHLLKSCLMISVTAKKGTLNPVACSHAPTPLCSDRIPVHL